MKNSRSAQVREQKGIPPLLRHYGATTDTVLADTPREAGTADGGQVSPDPWLMNAPQPLVLAARDMYDLRAALEQAALALHTLACDASVRLRQCVAPMCVRRVELLDRTGGSARG